MILVHGDPVQAAVDQRSSVLFVDDEPDIIDTFLNNFEDIFDVVTATSGPKALEILSMRERT